jgi:hypothetical protein
LPFYPPRHWDGCGKVRDDWRRSSPPWAPPVVAVQQAAVQVCVRGNPSTGARDELHRARLVSDLGGGQTGPLGRSTDRADGDRCGRARADWGRSGSSLTWAPPVVAVLHGQQPGPWGAPGRRPSAARTPCHDGGRRTHTRVPRRTRESGPGAALSPPGSPAGPVERAPRRTRGAGPGAALAFPGGPAGAFRRCGVARWKRRNGAGRTSTAGANSEGPRRLTRHDLSASRL